MSLDVVFATYRRAPDLDSDDVPLGAACSALGLTWRAVPWDDAAFDWASARAVVLRSPWDYTRRRAQFLAWCRGVAAVSRLFNPLEVVERNSEKSYLLDLASAGVPVVPTALVEAGAVSDLDALLEGFAWDDVVVKPTISAGSWRTYRVRRGERSHAAVRARRLLAVKPCLVQPFLPSVLDPGERALVFLDGTFSHAVRKRSTFEPADVPFRVPVEAAEDELDVARRALEALEARDMLYARVDLVRDAAGGPAVIEVELTEPRLFFGAAPPGAPGLMAQGIARRVR